MEMLLNIDKCMVLMKRRPLITRYTLHSLSIVSVNTAKYLGVTIDSKLSFNDHHSIDIICKKANSTLSFLHRNFSSCQLV